MADNSSEPATITIVQTPAGRGAVATVTIRGPLAVEMVARRFRSASGQYLVQSPVGRVLFGGYQSTTDIEEELVVCRTTEDEVEIHCHGGTAAAEAILQTLAEAGAIAAAPAGWLEVTEPDAIAAEAQLALAQATTDRTAGILLDQYRGALRREIEAIIASVDAERLERLCARIPTGVHLTSPFRVVLAGRPNVGKSSLINALCGYGRTIVSATAGTTRDVVTASAVFDGWPVELADTAGLRHSADELESAGIARARRQLGVADQVILVSENSGLWGPEEERLQTEFPAALIVYNKGDLPAAKDANRPPGLIVSAQTGDGLEWLQAMLALRLVSNPLQAGEAVPFTARQASLLRHAQTALPDAAAASDYLVQLLNRPSTIE